MISELGNALLSSDVNSEVVQRLKIAVKRGGGNKAVAARSGVKIGTLNNHLRSVTRLSADAAAKIAGACNVSIDWLLRGEGPMEYLPVGAVTKEGHVVEMGAPTPLAPERHPSDSFIKDFDPDRLASALKTAEAMFAIEKRRPNHRQLIQIMIIVYNEMTRQIVELAEKQSQNSVDSSNENLQS